ncbi:MAG: hypothetical protein ACK56I_10175, partial [bacterium]
ISVVDSGVFLSGNTDGDLYGFLMEPGSAPFGNRALGSPTEISYSMQANIVNYTKGYEYVTFNEAIPSGNPINVKCYYYAQGIPRSVFFYNNVLTIRPSPYTQYTVELGAYLTPAAFLTQSSAI